MSEISKIWQWLVRVAWCAKSFRGAFRYTAVFLYLEWNLIKSSRPIGSQLCGEWPLIGTSSAGSLWLSRPNNIFRKVAHCCQLQKNRHPKKWTHSMSCLFVIVVELSHFLSCFASNIAPVLLRKYSSIVFCVFMGRVLVKLFSKEIQFTSSNFFGLYLKRAMAWRASGTTNADFIDQLESKFKCLCINWFRRSLTL